MFFIADNSIIMYNFGQTKPNILPFTVDVEHWIDLCKGSFYVLDNATTLEKATLKKSLTTAMACKHNVLLMSGIGSVFNTKIYQHPPLKQLKAPAKSLT